MKKELDIFEIEYTESDLDYIDDLINILKNNYKDIMNFFGLNNNNEKINIKFWNSKEEYRIYFNNRYKKYGYDKTIPEWEIARSTNNEKENRIDLITYKEVLKCKGHNKDKINNLFNVIIHEFVHTCHFIYNNYTDSLTWFAEALATNLSNQYKEYPLTLNVPLNNIMDGLASYINFYTMGKYLLENYDKEYILELSKNRELLIKDTPKIYEETLNYIKNNNRRMWKNESN